MNSTKIQKENGKVKYVYDYPANREIAKHLTAEDKQTISFRTGFSMWYVGKWCQGIRKSRRIEELAHYLMKLNLAKHRKLNKLIESSTN